MKDIIIKTSKEFRSIKIRLNLHYILNAEVMLCLIFLTKSKLIPRLSIRTRGEISVVVNIYSILFYSEQIVLGNVMNLKG